MSDLWNKPFIFVCLANLFTFFGFQIIVPALPLYLDSLGTGSGHMGLILASFCLSVMLARPLAGGLLVDRGYDRLCIVLGILICLGGLAGYGLVVNLLFITMARFIHGVGFGFSSVAYGAMVARLLPASRRAEGMGYFALTASLGLCLGPLAGTYLMEYFNFHYTLACCALLLFVSLVWTAALPKWRPAADAPYERLSWHMFFEKKVWFPCALCAFLGASYGPVAAFITLWGKSQGIGNVGVFFLLNASCSLLVRLFAGRVADSMGKAWVIVPAGLVTGCSLLILYLFDGYSALVWSAICLGLGIGSGYPILQAWVIELAPPERRGAATAFFYNSFDLGLGLSIVLWGIIASRLGYGAMYGIASISMLVFLISYSLHCLRQPRASAG